MKFSFLKNVGGDFVEVSSCSKISEALQLRETYLKQGWSINLEVQGSIFFHRLMPKKQLVEKEFIPKNPCEKCHASQSAEIVYDYTFGGNRKVCKSCFEDIKPINDCTHAVRSL